MMHSIRIALGLLLGLGFAAAASAHAHLKSAEPAADSTAAPVAVLTLHFTEGVEPAFSGAALSGPGNQPVAVGASRLAAGDDTTLVVPLNGPLGPGRYAVSWHVLAKDGHKTNGSYAFTIQP